MWRRLTWKEGHEVKPHPFWDIDIHKTTEAACFFLMRTPNGPMMDAVEEAVEMIQNAQHEDGFVLHSEGPWPAEDEPTRQPRALLPLPPPRDGRRVRNTYREWPTARSRLECASILTPSLASSPGRSAANPATRKSRSAYSGSSISPRTRLLSSSPSTSSWGGAGDTRTTRLILTRRQRRGVEIRTMTWGPSGRAGMPTHGTTDTGRLTGRWLTQRRSRATRCRRCTTTQQPPT